MRITTFVPTLTIAAVALLAPRAAHAQKKRDFSPWLIANRGAEIALSRTAATEDISDGATVLVLTRTGYVEASHGTNGFTCLVLRSFAGPLDDPNFWNSKVRSPICFTPAAVRTVLPAMLKRADWILGGMTQSEIAARTKKAYASHELPTPAVGAMAYMISPKQYLQDEAPTTWLPHLMFFYDRSVSPAALGAGGQGSAMIDGTGGDKDTPVRVILIPVRNWSDGTPAVSSSPHKH